MGLSVVIMAAGAGTRMRSGLPKVLHGLCGKPMLHYVIEMAREVSDDITVVLYHQAQMVQESISHHFRGLRFVIQNHTLYPGTGGALMDVQPRYERILVLSGDMPLVEASELKALIAHTSPIVMSTLTPQDPTGYGRVVVEDGKILSIVEEKDATPDQKAIRTVNGGVYLFDRPILQRFLPKLTPKNAQKEYYLTDVIGMAADEGIAISPFLADTERFMGVNSKLDLANAERILQNRIKERWMKTGVSMRLPESIYIESDVEFEGECFLENGVSVLGSSRIIRSTLKAHTIVEESLIKESTIGPMARVRPGSEIHDSHIGNFVELKKARLHGVKAGHLSYLGDCQIDEGTNVGAGTITCNYDGKAKHTTTIGKNVFIGSDTQLVAPITVGDDVLIAAGTTLTQDVPSGSLAISRTNQVNKEGFFARFFGKKS